MSRGPKLVAEDVADAVPRLSDEVTCTEVSPDIIRLRGRDLRRSGLSRFLAWLFRLPRTVEVELDDLGTWVIRHMDGRTMAQLAQELSAERKLSLREAEFALTAFVQSLMVRRLVRLDGLIRSSA